jgi:putative membrane protein
MSHIAPGRVLPWLTAFLTITGVSAANAQMTARSMPPTGRAARSDSADRQMVFTLVRADREEVAMGRNALPTLQDAEVKKFAQRMIDDHGADLTAVSTIGTRLGFTLPTDPVEPSSTTGTTDAQYITMQVTGHRQLLSQLPAEPTTLQDPGLRRQVTNTRRAVQMHLDDAVRLQARLGGKMP